MLSSIFQNLKENDIEAYVINTNDEHINEYIGPSDERLKHITGFNGSNGMIIISEKKCYLYTDGRYHIQARKQLANSKFELVTDREEFFDKLKDYKTVGINKKQFSQKNMAKLSEKYKFKDHNIDSLLDLPKKKFNKLLNMEDIMAKDFLKAEKLKLLVKKYFSWLDYESIDFNMNVTGSIRNDKLTKLRDSMKNKDMFIITALDEIAYMLNLRGNDIIFNPVFYSYAIVTSKEVILFSEAKLSLEGIQSESYYAFDEYLDKIEGKNVFLSDSCNSFIFEKLKVKNEVAMSTIIADMKSVKNNCELLGFILAHIYDGCALYELFEHIQKELKINPNNISEKYITQKLVKIKEKYPGFFSPSFETISSSGKNSAIIHHTGDDTLISRDELYMIDSGSHYFFGTTDSTRTVSFNEPTNEQRQIFTDVLKAQLSAMLMNLPVTHPSSTMDSASRLEFFATRRNYEHSLGHGVGHFLNVHESPPSLSYVSTDPLKEKMVFSIEPGMYIENKHGVRIEDLVVSIKDGEYFNFFNITMFPLQNDLIILNEFTKKEQLHISDYNKKVDEVIHQFILKDK